jgi:hypothetical protein
MTHVDYENAYFILPRQWIDCPKWWKNFVKHVNPTNVLEPMVDEALVRDYDAVVSEDLIQFESTESLTAFILSWS